MIEWIRELRWRVEDWRWRSKRKRWDKQDAKHSELLFTEEDFDELFRYFEERDGGEGTDE